MLTVLLFAAFGSEVSAQNQPRLQIHYLDIGQGDAAVLVSARGEVVLFDDGQSCAKLRKELDRLSITKITYHIASHYHGDHVGCASTLQNVLEVAAYDRGDTPAGPAPARYTDAVAGKRFTAGAGDQITLDGASQYPTRITIVVLNGNGVLTNNENDLSVVAVVEYAGFRAEFGGDLSGRNESSYQDIETSVAPLVGQIDVYKVHQHCSRFSTNEQWLSQTEPTVAIISVGSGNRYGHPAQDCIDRLHQGGVTRVYWTELGNGARPTPPVDVVSGTVDVTVDAGAEEFTVSYGNGVHVERFGLKRPLYQPGVLMFD